MLVPRLALSACLVAGLACNSDDLYAGEALTSSGEPDTTATPTTGSPGSTTTVDPTTGDPTTGAAESTSTTTSTTGTETTDAPPEQTCRDILMCIGKCALTLDPACFQTCAEGLQPDEGLKAAQLGLCVGQGCFESGVCSPDTIQDPPCLACIGLGLLSPNPPGCEAEAEACS